MKTYRLHTLNDETLILTGDEILKLIENLPDELYIDYSEKYEAFFECVGDKKYWYSHGCPDWGGVDKKRHRKWRIWG